MSNPTTLSVPVPGIPGAVEPPPFTQHPPDTMPDKFTPPASFQQYPSFGNSQQQKIVTNYNPPWEDGPGLGPNGGQTTGVVNANPVKPLGQ